MFIFTIKVNKKWKVLWDNNFVTYGFVKNVQRILSRLTTFLKWI